MGSAASINSVANPFGIASYRNLAIAYASATTCTVTANEVMMQSASGVLKRFTSLSETVDITAAAASNGLDTGSEAVSTWYHIWAIGKDDGTQNCLLSASATAPTFPAGYTFKCYLGAVYNNSSGNFVAFNQVNNKVTTGLATVLSGVTSAGWASATLATIAPSTARIVGGQFYGSVWNITLDVRLASTSDGQAEIVCYRSEPGSTTMALNIPCSIVIITAQTVYYKTIAGYLSFYLDWWEY